MRIKEIDPLVPTGGPHRDYSNNLKNAENFIARVTKTKLPLGLSIEIRDAHHLLRTIVMISWSPPWGIKEGKFAYPVHLHADAYKVSREIETVFNNYFKRASDFWKATQLNLLEGIA